MPSVTSASYTTGEAPEGETPDLMHVMNGLVCVRWGEVTSSTPLEIYGSGSWICSGLPRLSHPGSLQCLTPTTLIRIPAALAEEAFNDEPNFARYVARTLMWRAEFSAQLLALTKAGSPSARVVLGMALLARAIASGSSHFPSLLMGESIQLPLNQHSLAEYLGLSRRHISLSLKSLSAAGWLKLGYGCIDLVNPRIWQALCEMHTGNSEQRQDRLYQLPMSGLLKIMESLDRK